MDFKRLIDVRRSLRAYSSRPVERDKVERMLDAARWSPSSANRQPWRFVVVEHDAPERLALEEALDAGNSWANRAPVLIVAGAVPSEGLVVESREYVLFDAGLALMSLLYRGADQGLLVHPMAGWKEAPLRDALGLPDSFAPLVVVAVGYHGKPEELDEATRKKDERPSTRKPLPEIAFENRWGVPYSTKIPSCPAKVFETDIQLRFRDTDAMGHVNNATVVSYLEVGRLRFLVELFGGEQVRNIPFIIADVSCSYRAPIFLHDQVRVRIWITDISRSSYRFRYEIFNPADGRIFVEAETVQVMYDYKAKQTIPLPPAFLDVVREYVAV
ncbi:MAG: nitroreductase family protein [Syntrophorhabdaceae bacterium]|nr:nitroreductase family protein [Syntrophorhabdaceae bacterium]